MIPKTIVRIQLNKDINYRIIEVGKKMLALSQQIRLSSKSPMEVQEVDFRDLGTKRVWVYTSIYGPLPFIPDFSNEEPSSKGVEIHFDEIVDEEVVSVLMKRCSNALKTIDISEVEVVGAEIVHQRVESEKTALNANGEVLF